MPLMGDVYLIASADQWMADRHMPLTAGEKCVLKTLLAGERKSQAENYEPTGDYPGDELTFCRPGGWYLGTVRQSGAVCRSLTRRAYISTTDRYDADYQTWLLNEDGRNAVLAAEKEVVLSLEAFRALHILAEGGGMRPREFSEVMWPDAPGHSRVCNVGNGAPRGVGRWRAGGCYLARLAKRGLVIRDFHRRLDNTISDDGYVLTIPGLAALAAEKEKT